MRNVLNFHAFPVLPSLCQKGPLRFDSDSGHLFLDLWNIHCKKLFPKIDFVEPKIVECPMKCSLKVWSVFGIDHGMHVEIKRHAGVSEFLDSIKWFKPSRETYFEDVFAKGTNI